MSGLDNLNLDDILGMLPKSEPTAKNSQLAAKEMFAVIDDPMINAAIFEGIEKPEVKSKEMFAVIDDPMINAAIFEGIEKPEIKAKEMFAVIDDPMINATIFEGIEKPEIEEDSEIKSMKKSGLVKDLAEKAGVEFIDIPFDTLESLDLSGLPKKIKTSKNKM